MTSITVASDKGGTGKTSISINLGVAIAQFGRDVIVLDSDIEMGNLEIHLGIEGARVNLHEVLAGKAELEEAIYEGPFGVRAVPAGISLSGLRRSDPKRIGEVVKELSRRTEMLIIDAPAGLGTPSLAALEAGKEVLLVVTPEISSMSDALKTIMVARKLGSRVLGAVLNRVSGDTADLAAEEVEAILETNVLAIIPEDLEMRKSPAFGQPVVIRCPNSPAAVAIKKLAAGLIGEEYIPPSRGKGLMRKLIGDLFGGGSPVEGL